MHSLGKTIVGIFLAAVSASAVLAQGSSQAQVSPPQVLQITREFTKPGKGGPAHEKTESLFVSAMRRANFPAHYVAMTSMTGKSRALFFTSYASFEAWENDDAAVEKNPALLSSLEHADALDGDLLDSVDQSVWLYNPGMSLRPVGDISHMRYMEISVYEVKPGHTREFLEGAKIVRDAYEKSDPSTHWAAFQLLYGGEGEAYVFLTSHKSLAEIDQSIAAQKGFMAAVGEDGMKHLDDLAAASIASYSNQLFSFNAAMSYVPEEWIKSDPDFWKPKASAPAAKPAAAAEKPKQ